MNKPANNAIFGNVAFAVAGQVLRYGSPFLFFPYLARTLDHAGFAAFGTVLITAQLLAQLVDLTTGYNAIRRIRAGHLNATDISGEYVHTLLVRLAMFAVVTAALAIFAHNDLFDVDYLPACAAICFGYGLNPDWVYICKGQPKKGTSTELIVSVLQLLLIFALVRKPADAQLALACLALPLGLHAFGGIVYLVHTRTVRPNLAEAWEVFLRALKSFFPISASTLIHRAGLMMLPHYYPSSAVAYYFAAERLYTAALNLAVPYTRNSLPIIAAHLSENSVKASQLFSRTALTAVGLTVGVALGTVMVAKPLTELLYGRQMIGAAACLAAFFIMLPAAFLHRIVCLLSYFPSSMVRSYSVFMLPYAVLNLAAVPLIARFWDIQVLIGAKAVLELLLVFALVLWINAANREDVVRLKFPAFRTRQQ